MVKELLQAIRSKDEWEKVVAFYSRRLFVMASMAKIVQQCNPKLPLERRREGFLFWCPSCQAAKHHAHRHCPNCGTTAYLPVPHIVWNLYCARCNQVQTFGIDGISTCGCGYRDFFYLFLRQVQRAIRSGKDNAVYQALVKVLYDFHQVPKEFEEVGQKTG